MRASALVCLSAGAGLVGADLKAVTGEDVVARSGGVVVCVRSGRRPRVVPVLSRYHDRLLSAAGFAGGRLVIGGTSPGRRNVTSPLTASLAGGRDLPRIEISRLRATWLCEAAGTIGIPGEKAELFFGYYCSLATMVADEGGAVPELVRRMNLVGCDHDPVPQMVGVLVKMPGAGIPLGDVICDSGYAHRVPEHFALPLRGAGASLVMDLHPSDRGTQGTHEGAILWNGNCYCPSTPAALFDLSPLAKGASPEVVADFDRRFGELSRYKLGRTAALDADGYERVACPAGMGKLRCPLRPASMSASLERPEVLSPPEHPPTCCAQQTITVPPSVNAKTAQRHDYMGKPWRRSFARRTAVERSNARIKDPATIDVARGWCRVMGLTSMSLFLACALVVRNLAVADAFEQRRVDDERRAAAGLSPRTRRRRRRRTLADLVGASANAPP